LGVETVYFTIASQNYVPQVRCLFESLRQHHPEARHLLCLVEEEQDASVLGDLDADVVLAREMVPGNFLDLAYTCSIKELSAAVKPSVMLRLLDQGAQRIVYIDPDCFLFGPLREVEDALKRGSNIVLTPFVTRPIEDDCTPSEKDFLRTGTYNLGFVAVRAGDETRRFLTWWRQRLSDLRNLVSQSGRFTDQKWVDLSPSFFNGVEVLRHPGYNLAYWNAFQRSIERRPGGWHVDGEPLRFFHFSGLPVDDVAQISRNQNRIGGTELGPFIAEFHTYLGRLASNALRPDQERPYSYGLYWGGEPIESQALRTALRRTLSAPVRNIKVFRDERRIARQLEPHPQLPAHEMFPISRLMYDALLDRPAIARRFPLFTAADRARFLLWVLVEGHSELQIDRRLLPWKELTTPVQGALGGRFAVPPLMWLLWLSDSKLRLNTSFDSEKGYAHLLQELRKQIVEGERPAWQLPSEYTDQIILGDLGDGISVAQYAVWLTRKDLQEVFDIETVKGRIALRTWCVGPSPPKEMPYMAELIATKGKASRAA
jgi:hypothetical protein